MSRPPIYVETFIHASLEAVWDATQDPARHREWDLRFTEIEYLPKSNPSEAQGFLYATRIGFGLRIEGRGESVTERIGTAGERTSVLRFWSDDPKSLIRSGGGYWRYLPEAAGIRFLTLYSYEPRFGLLGAWVDRWLFRPLLGWATAWSFDCLRIAVERGVPARALWTQTIAASIARIVLALIWIYQGLVPKLLFPDSGEEAILRGTGLFGGHEAVVLSILGLLEIGFGVALLRWADATRLLWLMIGGLLALLGGAALGQPSLLVAPFNPITLTLAMIGLAAIEVWLRRDPLPSAHHCLRQPPRGARSLS